MPQCTGCLLESCTGTTIYPHPHPSPWPWNPSPTVPAKPCPYPHPSPHRQLPSPSPLPHITTLSPSPFHPRTNCFPLLYTKALKHETIFCFFSVQDIRHVWGPDSWEVNSSCFVLPMHLLLRLTHEDDQTSDFRVQPLTTAVLPQTKAPLLR